MELTKEKALELHRQMWTDMQKMFGDKLSPRNKRRFKEKWCDEHFPGKDITHSCFLCEYTCQFSESGFEDCSRCPVVWPCESSGNVDDYFCGESNYVSMPISVILALPEREGV